MGDKSKIEWTDATWNVTYGCTRVSAGCDNCYAVRQTRRLAGTLDVAKGLVNEGKAHFNGEVRLLEDRLDQPLRWTKPRRIFVNSLSDLFHPRVPFEFVDLVFAVMALCPRHTFQVLTKRPERMQEYVLRHAPKDRRDTWTAGLAEPLAAIALPRGEPWPLTIPWPLPGVWLGTSVENQAAADERIPHLLQTPAAVRFLSCEPLLGPVDLGFDHRNHEKEWYGTHYLCLDCSTEDGGEHVEHFVYDGPQLDQVIVGGESGPGARPCNVEWIRDLVGQCRAAGVAPFVKQLGANVWVDESEPIGAWPHHVGFEVHRHGDRLHLRHRKGGDMSEWPEGLRVREMPTGHEKMADTLADTPTRAHREAL